MQGVCLTRDLWSLFLDMWQHAAALREGGRIAGLLSRAVTILQRDRPNFSPGIFHGLNVQFMMKIDQNANQFNINDAQPRLRHHLPLSSHFS